MTAEELATQDIKDELKLESKCFIAFREKLNPTMNEIVDNYTKLQEIIANGSNI